MTLESAVRIIVAGVGSLFVVQGLVWLPLTPGLAVFARIGLGAAVAYAVMPSPYRARLAVGIIAFAGAAGIAVLLENAMRSWIELTSMPSWQHYIVAAPLYVAYLGVYAFWLRRNRPDAAREV